MVIDPDLASALTPGGEPLQAAVNAALRQHLEHLRAAETAAARGEAIPFWLARDERGSSEIEDELRERVTQRRAGEGDR